MDAEDEDYCNFYLLECILYEPKGIQKFSRFSLSNCKGSILIRLYHNAADIQLHDYHYY